ncbi:MAG: hypothetical protein QOF73_2617 [Thermomicrobiales bacterium]|nr:hypothetical protein [Thermomicrobiales bacterium]
MLVAKSIAKLVSRSLPGGSAGRRRRGQSRRAAPRRCPGGTVPHRLGWSVELLVSGREAGTLSGPPEPVERDDDAAGGESTSKQTDGNRSPCSLRDVVAGGSGEWLSSIAQSGRTRGLGRCGCWRRSRSLVLRRRGRFHCAAVRGSGPVARTQAGRGSTREGLEVWVPEGRTVPLGACSVEIEHLGPAAGVTAAFLLMRDNVSPVATITAAAGRRLGPDASLGRASTQPVRRLPGIVEGGAVTLGTVRDRSPSPAEGSPTLALDAASNVGHCLWARTSSTPNRLRSSPSGCSHGQRERDRATVVTRRRQCLCSEGTSDSRGLLANPVLIQAATQRSTGTHQTDGGIAKGLIRAYAASRNATRRTDVP